MSLPSPLPDDPRKWDGWSQHTSNNPYERLCLDFGSHPTVEEIENNSRQLLIWWQKKLPLRNQTSNPLAQILRSGIDNAPRQITEARVELLNPERRAQIDHFLGKQARENALTEFRKFLEVALANKVLSVESEEYLHRMGLSLGLIEADTEAAIEAGLRSKGTVRARDVPAPEPVAVPEPVLAPEMTGAAVPSGNENAQPQTRRVSAEAGTRTRRVRNVTPESEFRRFLENSGVDEDSLSDEKRDMFIDYAENLGLNGGDAEDMVDQYLDALSDGTAVAKRPSSTTSIPPSVPVAPLRGATNSRTGSNGKPAAAPGAQPRTTPQVAARAPAAPTMSAEEERVLHRDFTNSVGQQMLFVPSATFTMGNSAPDAPTNEQPTCQVSLSRFFISRFPVTNLQFEKFSAAHISRRGAWADADHPAIYVSALDAAKFCQWLSARDRRRYRLPTEAEWEYAAKGETGRTYPWGEETGRGDLANFADANTTFAWADLSVDDGFAETAPVGSYPNGASPFGVEDMAGNVWEWCLDFHAEYKAGDKMNPRGPQTGVQRVYRGGSWKSRFANLRTTARSFNLATYASNDVGFRVVCECD